MKNRTKRLDYRVGLDIGAESVGWAVLRNADNKLIDMGVRIFSAAENSKSGESLAKPRRESRSFRRRLRRKAHRMERIRKLFVKSGLLTSQKCSQLFGAQPRKSFSESPWELRVKALDEKLKPDELARALYHIAKRRGFKSNRKKVNSKNKEKEEGQLLTAVRENRELLKKYRTVGEMVLRDKKFEKHKRNRLGTYEHTVGRKELEEEIKKIIESQKKMGFSIENSPDFSLDKFAEKFLEIMLGQRSFADGPARGPYAGNQVEKMRGMCTFEKGEKRCAKACFTFEKFQVLQNLSNLRLQLPGAGSWKLSEEQRNQLYKEALKRKKLKYKQVRKLLDIDESVGFNTLTYPSIQNGEGKTKDPEEATFIEMKAFHEIRKTIEKNLGKKYWEEKTKDEKFEDWLDNIGEVFSIYKTDDKIRNELQKLGFPEDEINALLALPGFSKFGHLSLKALKKINPYLEQGFKYNEACEKAGYDFRAHSRKKKQKILPKIPTEDIVNPVVIRALTQARKVLNAIIRKYGSPMSVYIETARDIGKSRDKKREIQEQIDRNRKRIEEAKKKIIEEYNIPRPSRDDALKLLFYEQQQGKCIYSLKDIDINRLFEHSYVELDHVLPYSRTFNNSQNNKVLVLSSENRDKCNRTPFEWFGDDESRWARFEGYVKSCKSLPYRKRLNLLRKKLTEEDIKNMQERSLNDTRYINRFFMNFIRDNLKFADGGGKKRVFSINGAATAYFRYHWGLHKEREESVLHHAVDAVVVACITDAMVKKISDASKKNEFYNRRVTRYVDPETGELLKSKYTRVFEKEPFPKPREKFMEEILKKKNEVFVSRMPRRKVTGAAHEDTIRSTKLLDESGCTTVRKALKDLKKSDLDNLCCKVNDPNLFDQIKNQIEEEGKITTPIYKKKKNGENGPRVRRVKVKSKKDVTGIRINEGLAKNGPMIRLDVFRKDGKNHFVPIYVSDTIKDQLPVDIKPSSKKYFRIDETYDFLFSLYYNDLIKITTGDKEEFVYYIGFDINSGSLKYIHHDSATLEPVRKGGKSLDIEKYAVDLLGNRYKVGKEKRQKFDVKQKN